MGARQATREHVLWQVRERLAAVHHARQAKGDLRCPECAPAHDPSQGRQDSAHLPRPPALLLRRRQEGGPDRRPGPDRFRRQMVRGLDCRHRGTEAPRERIQVRQGHARPADDRRHQGGRQDRASPEPRQARHPPGRRRRQRIGRLLLQARVDREDRRRRRSALGGDGDDVLDGFKGDACRC